MTSYQAFYGQKKITLYLAVRNGVLRVEDQVPDNNYLLITNRFPGAKDSGYLKCERKDFSGESVGSVRWKIRIFDSSTIGAWFTGSSPAGFGGSGVYFIYPSN